MNNESEVEQPQEMVGYQEKIQHWMENGGKRYYEAIVPTPDSPTEQMTNEPSLVKNPRFYAGLVVAFVSGVAMMALIAPSSVQELSPGPLNEDATIMHKNNVPSFLPTEAPTMPSLAPTRYPTMVSAHTFTAVSVFTYHVIVGVAAGGLALIALVYGLYYWGCFGKKTGETRPLKWFVIQ